MKIYKGRLFGIASLFKKDKHNEKLVLNVLEEAEADYPTQKKAIVRLNERGGNTQDFVLLYNQYESLVLEWRKKWLDIEIKGRF